MRQIVPRKCNCHHNPGKIASVISRFTIIQNRISKPGESGLYSNKRLEFDPCRLRLPYLSGVNGNFFTKNTDVFRKYAVV